MCGRVLGRSQQLMRNRNASRLKFQVIDHLLRPGEGRDVMRMLHGPPDCIVADCEDCLWGEYKKNAELFAEVKQIQVERDDLRGNYDSLRRRLGMTKVYTGRGCGVQAANPFHKAHGMSCTTEVWEHGRHV